MRGQLSRPGLVWHFSWTYSLKGFSVVVSDKHRRLKINKQPSRCNPISPSPYTHTFRRRSHELFYDNFSLLSVARNMIWNKMNCLTFFILFPSYFWSSVTRIMMRMKKWNEKRPTTSHKKAKWIWFWCLALWHAIWRKLIISFLACHPSHLNSPTLMMMNEKKFIKRNLFNRVLFTFRQEWEATEKIIKDIIKRSTLCFLGCFNGGITERFVKENSSLLFMRIKNFIANQFSIFRLPQIWMLRSIVGSQKKAFESRA